MRTGDVVIFVPVRKLSELLTNPVIDPSAFWTHFDKTGVLSLTGAAFLGAAFLGATFFGAAFTGAAAFLGAGLLAPPKSEKPDAAFFGSGVGSGLGSGFAFDPKREIVERALGVGLTGAGGSTTAFLAAGLGAPNQPPDFFGAGVGSAFGSGDLALGWAFAPNKERVGLGFDFTGAAGLGATGFFAAGLAALKKV